MGILSKILDVGRACVVFTDSKLKESCLHKAGRILGEGGESVLSTGSGRNMDN